MNKKVKISVSLLLVLAFMFTVFVAACGKTKYTIRFITDGGSAVADIVEPEGTAIPKPEDPVKEGYDFDGWYFDVEHKNPVEFPYTMKAESINVYAKWKLADFTVTYNTNGGSAVASVSAPAFTPIDVPAAPTKQGYQFAGWYSDEELTAPFDFVMPNRNATVFARWLKLEDKTAFELNKDWVIPEPNAYTVNYDEAKGETHVTALADKGTYSLIKVVIPYNVKNYGAFVINFSGTANEDILLKCEQGGVKATETKVRMTGSEQTHVWTVKPENLTDGQAPMNFIIFVRPGIAGGNNVELTIKSLKLYRVLGESDTAGSAIFFNTNGGTAVEPIFAATGAAVTEPTTVPEKAGYEFEGWYSDAELKNKYTFGTMPEGKTFLYANYTENNSVTLTFNTNGGDPIAPMTGPATSPIASADVPVPTKSNSIFDAWYLDAAFTQKFDFKNYPDKNTTLYACWGELEESSKIVLGPALSTTQANAYEIVNNADGTSVVTVKEKKAWDMFGASFHINAKDYRYVRVRFIGTEGVNLLMKFEGGGVTTQERRPSDTMTGEEQEILWEVPNSGFPDGLHANPTKFNMCLNPNNAVKDKDEIKVTILSIELLRLKPEGAADKNAVHFVVDGGKVDGKAISPLFVNKGDALTLPTPEKEGYTFLGWYTDEEFTQAAPTVMPEGNLTLYAKYEEKAAA